MANIDTSTIEGFEEMSADEKVTALLGYEIPDPTDLSGYVTKSVFDAKASEASGLAKQLKKLKDASDLSGAELTAAKKELDELKRSYYVASKGLSGDEAEFVAFKAAKMVDDKTTFEQAVDELTKDHKKPTFDWGAPLGGGEQPQNTNSQMNALIRGAFK